MSESPRNVTSRRHFLKHTGGVAAVSTLAGVAIPHVHAGENNTINVALIGAGGRGTGAAAQALSVKKGPTKLVAMADVFDARLKGSYESLKKMFPEKVDVPEDRKFIGFDGYKKAMDCLKPGDVAIFATPPAFRWVHFTYAIEKKLNVFMEKPVAVDAPGVRSVLATWASRWFSSRTPWPVASACSTLAQPTTSDQRSRRGSGLWASKPACFRNTRRD